MPPLSGSQNSVVPSACITVMRHGVRLISMRMPVCLDHNGIAGNVDFRCRSGIPSSGSIIRGVWAGFHRLWLVIYPKDIVLAYFQRKQI